jgi:hypothetical protein
MPTIHDNIEPWLAAAVHDELSPSERAEFDAHLATCATCRALHQEQTALSTMIQNTLHADRPDDAFEQRMLSGFRRTAARPRGNIVSIFSRVMHARAAQITAIAAVLLGLTQLGRLLTDENHFEIPAGERIGLAPRSAAAPAEASQRARAATSTQSKRESRVGGAGQSHAAVAPAPAQAPAFKNADASAPPPPSAAPADASQAERAVVTGSYVATAPAEEQLPITTYSADTPTEAEPTPGTPVGVPDNRKLIRNAQVELEVVKFDDAVQRITTFAAEDRGFVATSSSERQANGKLRGQLVVKVVPEKLDEFLLKLRGIGEVKNQTLGTDDVTKQYFDTESRLNNARVMEQRLVDILKTKTGKVSDLLEVEKELGRVREQIEGMQGSIKYLDAQIAFATVTITLAEKDMNLPAAFLLKRRAQLALFSTDVEKTFAEVKEVVDGAKAQISSSSLDRDSTGEATARLTLLIVPEEADALIERIKGMGRVQNYNEQTDRIAQGGGSGMSDTAKVERDKVELSITISRNEQEPALQTTSLRILTSGVTDKAAKLKENAAKFGAEIRSSSFNRNPDGQEFAYVTLRVAMKNYQPLISSLDQLGKVKDVSVHREDRRGVINEETAPADINIQVYSEGNIVTDESGIIATIRRTLTQGATALMWSLRMIGVAVAFLAPWALALAALIWVLKRVARARAARRAEHPGER